MKSRALQIVEVLLEGVNSKSRQLRELPLPEKSFYWHNVVYVFFSMCSYFRLFSGKQFNITDMLNYDLVPEYLCEFFLSEKKSLDSCLKKALEHIDEKTDLGLIRQEILGINIDYTGEKLNPFVDKSSRDATGSYYTSSDFAYEIVKKTFDGLEIDDNGSLSIADFSCGGGDFFQAALKYLSDCRKIPKEKAVKWFYGVDIDPIVLQVCIVNLLVYSNKKDWKEIISHFRFGNPLLISESSESDINKNYCFATRRLYNLVLGLPSEWYRKKYDIVLGNPPWEKIRFEERKFFRGLDNTISEIPQKKKRDLEVSKLEKTNSSLYEWRNEVYGDYSRMNSREYKHKYIFESVCGELNTYALFTELAAHMINPDGIVSLIVKSTLVTAPVNKTIWNSFLDDQMVKAVFIFDNRKKLFNIDSRERFVVIILVNGGYSSFEFGAGFTEPYMINDHDIITLSKKDLTNINPITVTIPNVSNNDDIEFLKDVHRDHSLFKDVYPDCHFGRLIHLTAHSENIETKQTESNVPIYEGKFIEQYDARYSTYRGVDYESRYVNKAAANKCMIGRDGKKEIPESRFFVKEDFWSSFLNRYNKEYSLCWRSLTSPTNRRTMIAMITPTCPTSQSIQMLQLEDSKELIVMLGLFNSKVFDYLVRLKMPGLDLTQNVVNQIPVPDKKDYEKEVELNGVVTSIRRHILSHIFFILKSEDRLKGLLEEIKEGVYLVEEGDIDCHINIIDHLFKMAYNISDDKYDTILSTFG